MTQFRGILRFTCTAALAASAFLPAAALAQSAGASKPEQWIHVRVESKEDSGETVRVNVPVEMAAKILPAIHQEKLHDGKIRIDSAHLNDVDLRAVLDAVRSSQDGEYVTVQGNDADVRVAKKGGYLYVHVTDRGDGKKVSKDAAKSAPAHEARVEIKVPVKVVDALFSAGKDELDIVAALRVLSAHGDSELVSVKDEQNTVRIWIDSKNIAD